MANLLSNKEIEQFIVDGFIRIDNAFSPELAKDAMNILWNDIPFERTNPASWTEPVVWLGMYSQEPFIASVNSPELHSIFDQLVGAGRWIPCKSVGAFPVRFPSEKQSNDDGKHVDAGFPGDDPSNYFEWRVNIRSKGRALLMLVLFSDVSENDAPTVLYKKSHHDTAKLLATKGESGLSFMELAEKTNEFPNREKLYATGKAGTIYLCHPFIVHSAQAHKGTVPKFMAQPPLLLRTELNLVDSQDGFTPVEQAIRLALA